MKHPNANTINARLFIDKRKLAQKVWLKLFRTYTVVYYCVIQKKFVYWDTIYAKH